MTVNQQFGYAFGAIYVLVGLLGFAVTGGTEFAGTEGNNLIIFEVNPLANIVHILVGALLLGGAARGAVASKQVNILVGAVYLVLGLVGFFIYGTAANILALNTADHFLHLATAALALFVGLAAPARARA